MKILDVTFKRKVNCSANVCLWNHWDQDHINYDKMQRLNYVIFGGQFNDKRDESK